jgi:hypothetical protein
MLKLHYVAIFLAILLGIFTLVPQLIVEHRMGNMYAGVHPQMNDDEIFYMARAQDIRDGHPTLGNPYLYEHKNEPSMQFWLPEALLGWIGNFFFDDLRNALLFWDFILPVLLFLLSYSVIFTLTKDRSLSITGTAFLHFGLFLQIFNRFPSPQFNFIFVLILMLALVRITSDAQKKIWTILATISFGALFYIYTYYWTFWVIGLALTIIGNFIFFRSTGMHKQLSVVLGGGLIIGIPYFAGMITTSALPYYSETLARLGMLGTHIPSGLLIVGLGSSLVLFYMLLWKFRLLKFTPLPLLLFFCALSGIIAVNQHIITGKNLEFSSHYRLITIFMVVFAFIFVIQSLLDRLHHRTRNFFHTTLIAATLIFSVVSAVQVVWAQSIPQEYNISEQRYGPIFSWLNKNTTIDDVVFTDDYLSPYISAYTHNNIFFSHGGNMYFVPQKEVRQRFLIQHYFDEPFSYDEVVRLEKQIYGTYYINRSAHQRTENRLRLLFGVPEEAVERHPEGDMQTLVREEQELRMRSFADALLGFRVDYLIWDKAVHPEWNMSSSTLLREVYQRDNILVYVLVR